MTGAAAFISYARADAEAATALAAELEAVGLPVWLDTEALEPGHNWVAEIERGLEEAGYLLLLLSAAALSSRWVEREWTTMLARQLGGKAGGVVIPLRLAPVTLPALLRPLQAIDLFPDFEAGLRSLVGFLLRETRPAWLVQREVQTRPTLADSATDPLLRSPDAAAGGHHGYAGATWQAWHGVMGHEWLTDAVLQALDKRTIRRVALHCVTLQHLQAFCFDTGTDRGALAGASINEQILSLLELLLREGRLEEFIRWLAEEADLCVAAAIRRFLPDVAYATSRSD